MSPSPVVYSPRAQPELTSASVPAIQDDAAKFDQQRIFWGISPLSESQFAPIGTMCAEYSIARASLGSVLTDLTEPIYRAVEQHGVRGALDAQSAGSRLQIHSAHSKPFISIYNPNFPIYLTTPDLAATTIERIIADGRSGAVFLGDIPRENWVLIFDTHNSLQDLDNGFAARVGALPYARVDLPLPNDGMPAQQKRTADYLAGALSSKPLSPLMTGLGDAANIARSNVSFRDRHGLIADLLERAGEVPPVRSEHGGIRLANLEACEPLVQNVLCLPESSRIALLQVLAAYAWDRLPRSSTASYRQWSKAAADPLKFYQTTKRDAA